MTDLVSQLVGALEGMLVLDEENHQLYPGDEDVCKEVRDAQAALTAAKAGGWVAVPVEPTQAMLDALHSSAYLPGCYRAMLAARPLTAPPAQKENT